MKILFQGDSVTDAGRDRSNPADLGEGYPKFASAMIQDSYPDDDFEFVETTDEQFESNYRTVLDAIKSRTKARILMIQPFLLETVDPAKQVLCEELARKQAIIKRLADEYADAYLPLDEILHQEVDAEPVHYAADGVHPTPDGACRIGEAYLGAIAPLIELLS